MTNGGLLVSRLNHGRLWIVQLAVGAFCLGCGSGEPAVKPRVALTGKVAYNGAPVEKGLLVLQPRESGQPVSTGINNGDYEFSTGTGPIAGRYHVIITRTGAEEIVIPKNRGFGAGGRDFPPPKRPVDTAGKKNSFELEYDVPAEAKVSHNFDLKD